jgi:hypothetical protein
LAKLWTQADSIKRRAITVASHDIDKRLSADPFGTGESRPGGRRILLIAPLGVTFRVETDGQTVSVLRVWLFRKRGP